MLMLFSLNIYIYIYAFSRCFYPKQLTVHSGYTLLFFLSVCDNMFSLFVWGLRAHFYLTMLQIFVAHKVASFICEGDVHFKSQKKLLPRSFIAKRMLEC